MRPESPTVEGPATALRWVLAQGVPAEIHVAGGSMEPTLPRGTRVKIVPVDDRTELAVGDVVVLGTEDPDVLIVHRLLHSFHEGGHRVIVHQGDAPGAAFSIASRGNVIARVDAVEKPADGARFLRRRLACHAYVLARSLAIFAGLERSPAVRRCAAIFRRLARRASG